MANKESLCLSLARLVAWSRPELADLFIYISARVAAVAPQPALAASWCCSVRATTRQTDAAAAKCSGRRLAAPTVAAEDNNKRKAGGLFPLLVLTRSVACLSIQNCPNLSEIVRLLAGPLVGRKSVVGPEELRSQVDQVSVSKESARNDVS